MCGGFKKGHEKEILQQKLNISVQVEIEQRICQIKINSHDE